MSNSLLRIKRNIAILLVVFLFVGLLPAQVFANEPKSFTDIKGHWAEESINKVVQEGLFNGSAEGVFEPQGSMTRAMFITVLNRLAEKLDGPEVAVKDQTFTDVPASAWYANAISWAVSAGLTDGYGNGTFGPNDLLNREQITVLMMRFLTSYMGYDLSKYQSSDLFADSDQISSWAKEAVYQAVALGLVQGEKGNLFNPKGTASRAVVAVITERFLEKSAELKVDKPSETPAPTTTPEPTATPEPTTPSSGGNGGGGGTNTVKVTGATIKRNNTDVAGTVIRSGDQLTVDVTPTNATKTVKWLVNDQLKSESATYTVQTFDVGAVITAEVTGTGKYSGTVTSAATGTVIALVDLANKDLDSAPVVVADDVVFVDENGDDITLNATDTVSFSVTASAAEVTEEEQENVTAALNKEFADAELDVASLNIKYFAIDAKLLVESAENNTSSEIHPVGKTTLTLSKANLGFAADVDITPYTFLIGHTNKKGIKENLIGKVVEISGEQFVRVELNGLSTVYIGNVPPLTLTFDTDGGSIIEPKKVKLGEITPAVAAPTKEGYFFIGWNVDLNKSPIYMNMTIKALWLKGAYIPEERLSLVDSNDIEIEDYSYNANGVVKVTLAESITYDANLQYTLNIEAPENATNYALRNSAEAAASAKVEDATAVDGIINVPIQITDAEAKVITGNYSSFIKWFDENGQEIILETVTVTVETDERAATREQTFDVNRGVGTVEVMLLAKDAEVENYVSYLNGYLSGSPIWNNYTLYLNASFDKYISGTSVQIDYNNYSGFKMIFTPFVDESYNNVVAKASAYYWDAINKQEKNIDLDTRVNADGLLEVTTKANQNLEQMAGTSNSLYLYVTVDVGGRTQQVNVNVYNVTSNVDEPIETINTDKWTEVVAALATYPKVYVNYRGEAVTLNNVLELQPKQNLNILNSNFTIGSGGELRLGGSVNGGAYVNTNGEIIVSSGGKITTTSQLESQGHYYYTGVSANKGITIEAGGEIAVPNIGLLSIRGNAGLFVKQDGLLNVKGDLMINTDADINGTMNIIGANQNYTNSLRGSVSIYGDLTINKLLEVSKNGQISVSGMTTIQENSELRLTKGNIRLNGKTYNYGKIAVQEGDLTLSNVGYAVNNDGIIELAAQARLTMPGTTLVNNKTISGSGTITLTEDVNAAANYDNGIKYVEVEGTPSPSNYNRYQFVSDPEATVTGIIYESKISGTGTKAESIKVIEFKIPTAEQ
ncbi:S-layer homology domain-containing protein [Paenibacillus endoradicis]|uniref:S-layer homology domain-containing protein n=1 Tax=Paenibacillus endoradicis TaxID=2972487 RepID=UPI0021597866|nr:S-layer homology domain-containing protein [Paenibacillus endoradicis]MCR8657487.1 S-layer homology domain-containing protein [Paenibacillus endoradicis]